MSFDDATRRNLAKMVTACRSALVEDLEEQLQRNYGLQPDGKDLPVEKLQHLNEANRRIARELRDWRDHLAAVELGDEDERRIKAFSRMALESAFTVLNRLAALRMCEERDLLIECVRKDVGSSGFQLYQRLGADRIGEQWIAYRRFLERQFDDLAVDLGALFDRSAPHSLLFPSQRCLEGVLKELNDGELSHLWAQDETIGWIYQYFNPDAERKKMRKESSAPRNSRELAVRNQFFTPRYVVEFLTDNTLGRTWYEMRQGRTELVDRCTYLVRRPDEVFLSRLTSPEAGEAGVAEMARQLQEGTDATFPAFSIEAPNALNELAHCVDIYLRERDAAELWALNDQLRGGRRWPR